MKNLYTLALRRFSKLFFIALFFLTGSSYAQESMRANLYVLDASGPILLDGNFTEYKSTFSNDVDIYDAWKMVNPGVNFGIYRSDINLAVERRNVVRASDTTFFRMWNMPAANFSIKFSISNMEQTGRHCTVIDNYLHTKTPLGLNESTEYKFTIDSNPASAAEMRFQLVYFVDPPPVVEVNFKEIKAERKNTDILVQWEVANEKTISSYVIEHSLDGINFTGLNEVSASAGVIASKVYDYTDLSVLRTANYYRIKALNAGGMVQYSTVVKVKEIKVQQEMIVYPNPVVNKTVQLQFGDFSAGKYAVALLYNNGVQQSLSSFTLVDGQRTQSVNLPQSLAPGIYRLQLTGPNNVRIVKTINVL